MARDIQVLDVSCPQPVTASASLQLHAGSLQPALEQCAVHNSHSQTLVHTVQLFTTHFTVYITWVSSCMSVTVQYCYVEKQLAAGKDRYAKVVSPDSSYIGGVLKHTLSVSVLSFCIL